VWTWKTTTHFKTLYKETRRKKTRRKRGGRQNDVVGCRRVLQLREQLHHPKKTLNVGDGDEFVVVVESSSKSSSKSQRRRRSFHKNGRRD